MERIAPSCTPTALVIEAPRRSDDSLREPIFVDFVERACNDVARNVGTALGSPSVDFDVDSREYASRRAWVGVR
jgi:hypothetical protein